MLKLSDLSEGQLIEVVEHSSKPSIVAVGAVGRIGHISPDHVVLVINEMQILLPTERGQVWWIAKHPSIIDDVWVELRKALKADPAWPDDALVALAIVQERVGKAQGLILESRRVDFMPILVAALRLVLSVEKYPSLGYSRHKQEMP